MACEAAAGDFFMMFAKFSAYAAALRIESAIAKKLAASWDSVSAMSKGGVVEGSDLRMMVVEILYSVWHVMLVNKCLKELFQLVGKDFKGKRQQVSG